MGFSGNRSGRAFAFHCAPRICSRVRRNGTKAQAETEERPRGQTSCLRRKAGGASEEIWWRPNEASNSIGNLVLHICGNMRQWIISGLGGAEDLRQRDKEFTERGPVAREALLEEL